MIQLDINQSEIFENSTSEFTSYQLDPSSPTMKPQPAMKFVIIEFSLDFLKLALQKLRSSIWWNSEAFFIVENSERKNTCANAPDYFNVIWEFNILSAVLLCQGDAELKIFSFNPYNSDAPNYWVKSQTTQQANGHPMILFRRDNYSKG